MICQHIAVRHPGAPLAGRAVLVGPGSQVPGQVSLCRQARAVLCQRQREHGTGIGHERSALRGPIASGDAAAAAPGLGRRDAVETPPDAPDAKHCDARGGRCPPPGTASPLIGRLLDQLRVDVSQYPKQLFTCQHRTPSFSKKARRAFRVRKRRERSAPLRRRSAWRCPPCCCRTSSAAGTSPGCPGAGCGGTG